MSTRRKSISIPDVPLWSDREREKKRLWSDKIWMEHKKSLTFVTFLCNGIAKPATTLQKN